MSAAPHSFAELGLPPNADRSAVDRAYRALMKVHHPDRGGDPARASAINRAYSEITRASAGPVVPAPSDLANAIYERRIRERRAAETKNRSGRHWPWALLLALLLGGATWLERDLLAQAMLELRWHYFPNIMADRDDQSNGSKGFEPSDSVKGPIKAETLVQAVATARAVLAKGGLDAASDASGRCYRRLASSPAFGALDRCVALDDAVIRLAGSAAGDKHGFSAVAVTARQLAAGRALGADYGAIEERLDQVRASTLRLVEPGAYPTMVPAVAGRRL